MNLHVYLKVSESIVLKSISLNFCRKSMTSSGLIICAGLVWDSLTPSASISLGLSKPWTALLVVFCSSSSIRF